MRVAALYDVHGNLPALEAVLAELDTDGVEAIVCGGDVVWGPQPAECLALLRERDALFVRGNCERLVLARDGESNAWCDDRLHEDGRMFVAALPLTATLDGVVYCHASPRSDDEIITAATPLLAVAESLAGVEEALVVCGHTHHQFVHDIGRIRLANAGSVGLPYEGDAAAFWAVVENGALLHRRTAYDVERAVTELVATGFPGAAGLLADSLVDPVPREHAIAEFEARAERGA